eukprot:737475_1
MSHLRFMSITVNGTDDNVLKELNIIPFSVSGPGMSEYQRVVACTPDELDGRDEFKCALDTGNYAFFVKLSLYEEQISHKYLDVWFECSDSCGPLPTSVHQHKNSLCAHTPPMGACNVYDHDCRSGYETTWDEYVMCTYRGWHPADPCKKKVDYCLNDKIPLIDLNTRKVVISDPDVRYGYIGS